jgi:hypothetical protein
MDLKNVIKLDHRRRRLKSIRWNPFADSKWKSPYAAYPTYIEMLNLILGFFLGLSLGFGLGLTLGLLIIGGSLG